MCPACLTTAALVAAGASSSGGLAALALRTLCGTVRDEASLLSPLAWWRRHDHSDDMATVMETDR